MTTAHRAITDADSHQLGYRQGADPGAVGAGKVWHDTDDDKVYVRNAADSGWVEISGGAAIDYAEDADISTQAFGDAAAAGASVTEVAGANHKHGMPADPVTAHVALPNAHHNQAHAVSGADHTGSVAAAQMPALTGAVTTSAGAVATTIAADAVTYAKMQNVSATARILARITAAAGDVEEATIQQVLALIATARGDLITRDATQPVRKAIGAANTALESDGTDPQWRTRKGFEGTATAQAVANAALDAIEWTEVRDTDAFHAGTSNAVVIPAGLAGWYMMSASCDFSSETTYRWMTIQKNGAALCYGMDTSGGQRRNVTWMGYLAVADSITVLVYANAAGVTATAQFGLIYMGA